MNYENDFINIESFFYNRKHTSLYPKPQIPFLLTDRIMRVGIIAGVSIPCKLGKENPAPWIIPPS
jgi:hypothetical protein